VTIAASNATLRTGDYVKIAGVTPAGYNGTWQITVLSNTTFTYVCTTSGLGASSVAGTYNKAGIGWTAPFTGTNASQYKMGNSGGYFGGTSSGMVIEVQDNGAFAGGAKECGVRGAESTTGMGAFTGPFPTVAQQTNGLCWTKSATADATARAWTLIGDDKGFCLFMNANATAATTQPLFFGWFPSFKSGDLFNCALGGSPTFNTTGGTTPLMCSAIIALTTANNNIYVARASSQTGGAISCNGWFAGSSGTTTTVFGFNGLTYPNGPDGALWLDAVKITDGVAASIRGRLAGTFAPMHPSPLGLYDTATNNVGLPGVTLLAIPCGTAAAAGQFLIDITGPW
jgi:hypothetical protein